MIHRNLQEACKVLHLSSILEHYDEVVCKCQHKHVHFRLFKHVQI